MDSQEPLTNEQSRPVHLNDYLKVLRERWWVIVVCVLVILVAVMVQSYRQTPQYSATAKIVRQQGSLESALFGTQFLQYSDPVRALQTAASTVTVEGVATLVKQELNSQRSLTELSGMVTATPDTKSDVISIAAVGTSAGETADVANSFARQFITYSADADKQAIGLAQRVVQKQIDAMSAGELASNSGLLLVSRLEELAIIQELQTGGYNVSQPATAPGAPFSPQPFRNGVLALAVGLVLGLGLAFLLEYLDKRIKDEETMEREFGLPILATVPVVGGKWQDIPKGRSDIAIGFAEKQSPMIESFRTLRSNLQYFSVDKELRTVLITSSLPREGKTTTTINLGLSLALAGFRVIVVEADLRRPMIHKYLKLSNDVGVSSLLAGTHTFTEAMQLVRVDDYMPDTTRRRTHAGADALLMQKNFYCITSGPLPPNPSELVGSLKMQELLRQAADNADYVLVDTPPLLVVADTLSLAPKVDGVLLTARLFNTTRDEAQASVALLERVGAHAIGVVAGGVKMHRSYYRKGYYKGYDKRYGYGYGYGPYASEPEGSKPAT